MSETSIVPFLHHLHTPGANLDVLAGDVVRLAGDEHRAGVYAWAARGSLELPVGALATLLRRAYEEGARWPGRRDELEARIRETAETAAAAPRCVCGAELRGDACTRDPAPPRCAKCHHALSHGTCPQCEPIAWLQSTHACVTIRYRPEGASGGRRSWARVVVGLAGERECGAKALEGCYLDADVEWSAPIGALVAEVYPWGSVKNGGERVRLCRVRSDGNGRGRLEEIEAGPWEWCEEWISFRAAALAELERGRVA